MSYTEFLASTVSHRMMQDRGYLWDAFRRIDANGDGVLSRDEVGALISSMDQSAAAYGKAARRPPQSTPAEEGTRADSRLVFDKVDKDGDGKISFDEFCEAVRKADEGTSSHRGESI